MPELVSLLEAIGSGGIEASVITTFNAYLPFYEDVVLRRLLASGCRHNAVMMDSAQLAACMDSAALRPSSAGYDYTMVPIRSDGVFHPKILLMVGPKKAITCIGSHNLTMSGFGLNREATCRLLWAGKNEDLNSDISRAAWIAVKHWLKEGGESLPRQAHRNIVTIEEIAPWLRTAPGDHDECKLLFQGRGTPSLWDQLRQQIAGAVKRITVMGAFFDAGCEFLAQLQALFPSAKLQIAVEPETVYLLKKGAARIQGSWRNASDFLNRPGYLHAKLLFLDTGGRSDLLAIGSANPSAPAWGFGKGDRNDEAVITWTGPKAREFAQALGLGEVKDLPEMDAAALRRIDATSVARPVNVSSGRISYGIAVAAVEAIEIPTSALRAEAISFSLLDESGRDLFVGLDWDEHSGVIRLKLPGAPFDEVRFVRVLYQRGQPTLLICHHEQRRDAAARTGRQAQLRQALASLEGDPANLATLIAAVQRVVFASDARAAPLAPTQGGARAVKSPNGEITTLEGAANAEARGKARPRLAEGDLGYLLQVLIYDLGKSVPPNTSGGTLGARSEEEQVDKDDETPATAAVALADDRELAEVVGRKVGTLVNRMAKVLAATVDAHDTSLIAVAQLTAVLCTLRALRQLDRQDRWRRTGISLVPEEYRYKMFQGILDFVIGGPKPLIKRAEVLEVSHSMEVVNLRGLLIWLAWECKCRADRQFNLGDERSDRDENVLDRAALLELIVPVIPDEDAISAAEKSVEQSATARQSISARHWLQTHFAWGRRIAKSARSASSQPNQTKRNHALGSVVALDTARGQSLHIVAGQFAGVVVLIDFSSETGEREFLRDRVIPIAAP